MTVISGYFDILWTEVDIEKINGELSELQNRLNVDAFDEYTILNILNISKLEL